MHAIRRSAGCWVRRSWKARPLATPTGRSPRPPAGPWSPAIATASSTAVTGRRSGAMATTWSGGPAAARRRCPTWPSSAAATTGCCTKRAGRWKERMGAGSPGRQVIEFRRMPDPREGRYLARPRHRRFRGRPIHRVGQVLGEVLHLKLRFRALGGDAVAEHRQAEGARRRDPRRLGPQSLLDAVVVDARPDLLLHPHAAAAGPAAEASLVVALDLDELRARDGLDDRTGRVIDVIPAAEVARIVVGELAVDRFARLELALLDQAGQQLRVMDDLVVPAELGELVLDGVEAVRAGRDHLPNLGGVHRLDVGLGLGLVQVLVADAPRRVAVAGLRPAEDGEVDTGFLQQPDEGTRHRPVGLVI